MSRFVWIATGLGLILCAPFMATAASELDLLSHVIQSHASTPHSGSGVAFYDIWNSLSQLIVNIFVQPLVALSAYRPGEINAFCYFIVFYILIITLFRVGFVHHLRVRTHTSHSLAFFLTYFVALIIVSSMFLTAISHFLPAGLWLTNLHLFIFLTIMMGAYRIFIFLISPPKKHSKHKKDAPAYTYFTEMPKTEKMLRFQVYFTRISYPICALVGVIGLSLNNAYWGQALHICVQTLFFIYTVAFSLYLISLWHNKILRLFIFIGFITVAIITYCGWLTSLFIDHMREWGTWGLTFLFSFFPFLLLPFFKKVGLATYKHLPKAHISKSENAAYFYLKKLIPISTTVKWLLFIAVLLPIIHIILFFHDHDKIFTWVNNLISSIFERGTIALFVLIFGLSGHSYLLRKLKSLKIDSPLDIYNAPKQHKLFALLTLLSHIYPLLLTITFLIVGLSLLGFDTSYVTTFLGLVVAAFVFVGKRFIMDVLKGIIYSFQGLIQEGLYLELNDSITGTVTKMYFQCVSLQDATGNVHSIEYGNIRTIMHFSDQHTHLKFALPLSTPMEDVVKLIRDIKEKFNQANPDTPISQLDIIQIDETDGKTLTLTIRLKTDPLKQWKIREKLKDILIKEARKAKISLIFPDDNPPAVAKK